MARPRAADYEDKRRRILDAAAVAFARHGFSRAKIADIAAACGIAKGLIYHYFPSKEHLLDEMLAQHLQDLRLPLERALDSSRDPRVQFRAFVQASMAVYAGSPEKHVVLMNDLGALPPDRAESIRRSERELVDAVVGLLERIDPGLAQRPDLKKPFAMMFYGLLNWTYVWYDPDGPLDARAFAQLAADTFLDGFTSHPRPDG